VDVRAPRRSPFVVERGARCNCTGTREKVHWVLVPSPEGSSVRRPRYLSEVMTVGGCVSVPSCLWNSTTLCPQHQRYPRDTQHSTPKGVSALPHASPLQDVLGPFKHTATPQLDSFLSELTPMSPFFLLSFLSLCLVLNHSCPQGNPEGPTGLQPPQVFPMVLPQRCSSPPST
jgi:hypothetical protein